MSAEVIRLINEYRVSNGRNPLAANASLNAAAGGYARLLGEWNFFGHDGLDGSSPQSRIAAAGYGGRFKGEALSAGQTSAQAAVVAWLNSPAHAAIIFDPSAVEVGVGYHYAGGSAYGHYWVFVTGAP
jgi:uncharacterized protein YkwD